MPGPPLRARDVLQSTGFFLLTVIGAVRSMNLPDTDLSLEPPEAPSVPRLTPPGALLGVLFRPRVTFQTMREAASGHWWLVALLGLLGLLFLSVATAPVQSAMIQTQFNARQEAVGAPADDSQQAEQAQQMQAIASSQAMLAAIGTATGLVGLFINFLLHASLLFLLGLAMGGRTGFRQVFRMAVWTMLPSVARNFVAAITILATGNLSAPGLSYALTGAEAQASPLLAGLLQTVDIYRLWMLVLIGLGVAATFRLSRVKSAGIVLIYWVIYIGVTLAASALGQVIGGVFGGG